MRKLGLIFRLMSVVNLDQMPEEHWLTPAVGN
jgi:hypothetical protein